MHVVEKQLTLIMWIDWNWTSAGSQGAEKEICLSDLVLKIEICGAVSVLISVYFMILKEMKDIKIQ